ncbi:uncharacterized protein LOC112595618 isoform X3 [Melanaphis sacchari]|uniref:uncharacterized protein LOC112595618 isoform X3 n=1 Tax=Melanaphis sacchari TaxID=742174 RepID=UPI000DC15312|nr:uncharacterized protein LOC112595618 isoform X3 [Melanaphis sacchari]
MADATHKTLTDGIKRWKTINFYLSIVKYIICNVLRILLYIAAYMMRKCSSLFESLSEGLKMIEKAEDTTEKTIKDRCDTYCFSNHADKDEELKEKKQIIINTVDELIDKESNSDTNNIGKNEERKEVNNIIGDVMNELIDNVTIKNNGQSFFEHNIDAEQKLVNGAITNIVNSAINKESNSEISEESVHSNSEDTEEKVEEKIIVDDGIESPRVRKRFGVKNTAILLITKTIKENKLKDKQFKMETEFNRNKILNNGNPYRDKDEIFTNKSDSFKREKESLLKNEPEKSDCFEVANKSCSKDMAIDSTSKYKSDRINLDIFKTKESIENQLKINENEKLTMKNNVDCLVNDDSNESKKPFTKTENEIIENNGEHKKNINGYVNKKVITRIENMTITKNNDVHWKNFDDYVNSKPNTMTENIIATNNDKCWDDNNVCENREPITNTENMTIKNNSELQKNNNSFENKKSIAKTEKMLNMFEVKDDIFSLPSKFSLAHCVCEDFYNAFGMTADFKFKFGNIGTLMDLNLHVSDVGHIKYNEQHVFYLVVKKKSSQKPLLSSLEVALYNLRDKMNDLKLTKLAIPKHGFDAYNMMDVKSLISKIFALSNIEVTICLTSSKLETEHINPPKINFTSKQLWEMEKQTDLIIFINMCSMYSENWNDQVVEHINAKYPFKERLLNDINIKPMAPGDILLYKIGTEVLFCIFIKPFDQNPSYFKCLEKAFQEMKSQLTGYRYLGVQQDPLIHKTNTHNLARNLSMLKSVFSNRNAEIWVCGDTEQHKTYQYQQYKKTVTDAIDVNHKRNSKTSAKSRNKLDKKRHSTNNNSKHGSAENYNCKNTSVVNSVTRLNQEEISIDNYMTENWDN